MKLSRWLAVAVVLSSLALGATGATGATGASGNRAVIDFYRKVVAATVAADGAKFTYGASAPFDQLRLAGSGWRVYADSWSRAGYYPVDDTFYVAASHGRITFVTDTLSWGGRGPRFKSFGEVLTALGEVELAGGAAASSTPTASQAQIQPCVGRVRGAVAGLTKVGAPSGYGLYGDFRSMKRAGPNEVVVSSYPFGRGHVATETDVIDRATLLPLRGTTSVSGAPGEPAYTMRWTVAWYHTALYLPRTNGTCASINTGIAV